VLAGMVPALRASGGDVRATLQSGAAIGGSRRLIRSDAVLIFAQAAAGIALLVTGLLIVRSFATLAARPLGFASDRVRTIGLELPPGTSDAVATQVRRRVYEELKTRVPVALADGVPGMTLSTSISRPESPRGNASQSPVHAWPVSGTFFDVFGMRLVRGRLFDDVEAFSNAPVAVIDQRAAELLWPGVDPIGRSVREYDGTIRAVVGVVQTVRSDFLGAGFQKGGAFIPFSRAWGYYLAYRVDRADVPVADLTSVASAVLPGARVTTRPLQVFEDQLGQPRFLALLLGALGTLAMVLTFIGVLGVVNHEVVRRTREIGIRLALGADATRIRRFVLRGALIPAFLGGVLGLSASLWFTETLRALLYGLNPHEPGVYVSALAAMLLTVAIGSFAPASRASRTDPMISLRAE
jgi:putative ABC transport system permease protein